MAVSKEGSCGNGDAGAWSQAVGTTGAGDSLASTVGAAHDMAEVVGEMWGRAERAHYIVGANPEMLTPSEFGGMVAAFGKKVRTAKGRVLWYLGLIAFESQKSGHCGPSS